MFRKEIILSIGSYAHATSTPFEPIEDYFLYSRLLQRYSDFLLKFHFYTHNLSK